MRLSALLLAALLPACASTSVLRGGGDSIRAAQALDFNARPRVAVAPIIDKTGGALISEAVRIGGDGSVSGITGGLRDLLTTELFGSQRFIVLERDALTAIEVEQEFSRSLEASSQTALPLAKLEGAQLLVLGAITAFDTGSDGAVLPIPIQLSTRGDFGVLSLRAKRGYVAMDLRVVDVRTGRVLSSTAVEGRNWKLGFDFTGFFDIGYDTIKLPGLLRYYQNTPVQEALQKMVTAAVARIALNTQDKGKQ